MSEQTARRITNIDPTAAKALRIIARWNGYVQISTKNYAAGSRVSRRGITDLLANGSILFYKTKEQFHITNTGREILAIWRRETEPRRPDQRKA